MLCFVFLHAKIELTKALVKNNKPVEALSHFETELLLFNVANWFIMTICREKEPEKSCRNQICR